MKKIFCLTITLALLTGISASNLFGSIYEPLSFDDDELPEYVSLGDLDNFFLFDDDELPEYVSL